MYAHATAIAAGTASAIRPIITGSEGGDDDDVVGHWQHFYAAPALCPLLSRSLSLPSPRRRRDELRCVASDKFGIEISNA